MPLKKRMLLVMVGIIAGTVLTFSAAFANETGGTNGNTGIDKKAAMVNETIITSSELDREVDTVRKRFMQSGQTLTEEKLKEIRKEMLDNLINRELLCQEAHKAGITVPEASLQEKIASIKKRFPSEAEFKKILAQNNISEEEMKEQIRKDMAVQQLIDTNITPKISISDEECKKYYDENPQFFKQPEQVKASHILIKVESGADEAKKAEAKKKISEILAQLKAGGNFAELAKEHSQCPSSSKGGDLGYFRRGQMVKPFEEAAFTTKPGELSDIVETQFGYHIIQVTDQKPEGVIPFENAKEKISAYLKQAKVQETLQNHLEELKKKATIERYVP